MRKLKGRKVLRKFAGFTLMLLVGVAMFYLLAFVLSPYERMSIYPAAILRIYVGMLALVYMDKIHHADYNTKDAVRDKNVPYALMFLAYALIIAGVLMAV